MKLLKVLMFLNAGSIIFNFGCVIYSIATNGPITTLIAAISVIFANVYAFVAIKNTFNAENKLKKVMK